MEPSLRVAIGQTEIFGARHPSSVRQHSEKRRDLPILAQHIGGVAARRKVNGEPRRQRLFIERKCGLVSANPLAGHRKPRASRAERIAQADAGRGEC
jgi:hypothetical protein